VRSGTRSIAERLQCSAAGPLLRLLASVLKAPFWRLRGSPPPAPPHLKRAIIAKYVRYHHPSSFIETGTFRGDTVAQIAALVSNVISIELDETLWQAADRRFARRSHVRIMHGDSEKLLASVVVELRGPALFWLDGHYSGRSTALGSSPTPIMAELETILASDHGHIVLIDDARLFDEINGWPSLAEIEDLMTKRRPDATWLVRDDIIRIEVPTSPAASTSGIAMNTPSKRAH
jgi:hypothetical protein